MENEKEIQKSCFSCGFHDGICCMFNCACLAIFDEEESASDCVNYSEGEYNQAILETTNYKKILL